MTNTGSYTETSEDLQKSKEACEPHILVLRDFCTRLQGSHCSDCKSACPHLAITFGDDRLAQIDPQNCTTCGICLGICDAFTSDRITMTDLHARMCRIAQEGKKIVVTCTENIVSDREVADNVVVVPCLAVLPPELWAVLLAEDIPISIAADLACCEDCAPTKSTGMHVFSAAIDTAQSWTGRAVGFEEIIPKRQDFLTTFDNPTHTDRRSALTNLAKEVVDVASGAYRARTSNVVARFYEQKERAHAQTLLALNTIDHFNTFAPEGQTKKTLFPNRHLLLQALEADPSCAPNIPITISQTDTSACENTQACTAVCPTGARFSHPDDGSLAFDPRYCIGCGLCEDACPHHAIDLLSQTAEVFLVGHPTQTP